MKKFLFVLFGVFVIVGAFAAGENIPTSKGYVDSKKGEKQDIIPANDGAPRVLTNTGTAGEYGTKGIYNATGEYATQTQNLVDAATMNAGVQNAIDSEFQCIEWLDPNDHTSDCLLFNIFGPSPQQIIPREYTQLEYLESTGLEGINSGVKASPITMIKAKFQIIGTPTKAADYGFLRSYTLPTSKYYPYLFNRSVDLSVYTSIGGRRTNTITDHDVHTLEIRSNGDYYLDETLKATNIYANSETNDIEIGIFRSKYSQGYMGSLASRFYHIELDNGEIRRNMIPARRKSDNVLGMYDTVSNTFFENACSGEFIAGPVVYMPQGE
jgi:hypothetical protein